jgi:tRNA modification GTPase
MGGNSASTIYAAASGSFRAAVTVLRVSGPESSGILINLIGDLPPPRVAALRRIRGQDGAMVDRGLVLWFPAPRSYTGEDCAELHVHGGRAVLKAVTAALEHAGARQAEAGEFTRRAFLNGRMDLLEAEGIADLVAAETEAQRAQALRQMGGEQSRVLAGWAERLRRLLAWQEALIDFPDEDLPVSVEASLLTDLAALQAELDEACRNAERGARLRDGLVFAVTGAPNVGKSSLVNALARRDVAIVSATPGTTRDAIEVTLELGGVPVTLVDTAGLRDTDDPIEAEGVRRARARAEDADLVVRVVDASAAHAWEGDATGDELVVVNKIDLAPAGGGACGVSAATGEGLTQLEAMLAARAQLLAFPLSGVVLSRARHIASLRDAAASLAAARGAALPELRGEELRLAMQALGRITGSVGVEDVLDTVFSAFCIGK